MQIIKCLSEKIQEELHDAEAYIELAMEWKKDEPEAADLFAELSEEEMGHVNMLHKQVTELIAEYREQNGEPPKGMMELYNYLHEHHLQDAMRIKVKQGIYKQD